MSLSRVSSGSFDSARPSEASGEECANDWGSSHTNALRRHVGSQVRPRPSWAPSSSMERGNSRHAKAGRNRHEQRKVPERPRWRVVPEGLPYTVMVCSDDDLVIVIRVSGELSRVSSQLAEKLGSPRLYQGSSRPQTTTGRYCPMSGSWSIWFLCAPSNLDLSSMLTRRAA